MMLKQPQWSCQRLTQVTIEAEKDMTIEPAKQKRYTIEMRVACYGETGLVICYCETGKSTIEECRSSVVLFGYMG